MSSFSHDSVIATRSTGLIESIPDNSSSFGKSDRALIKRIFGRDVFLTRRSKGWFGSTALVVFTRMILFELR